MKKTLMTLAALAAASVAQAATIEDAVINVAFPTSMVEGTGEDKDFSTSNGEYTMIFVMDRADTITSLSGYGKGTLGEWTSISIGAAGSGMYWKHSIGLFKNDYNNLCATLWNDSDRIMTFDSYTGSPYPDGATSDSVVFANEGNANEANKGKYALSLTVANTTWTEDVVSTDEDGNEVTTQVQKQGLTFTLGTLEGDGSLSTVSYTHLKWNPTQAFDSIQISDSAGLIEHMMVFEGVLSNNDIAAIAQKAVPEPTTATLSLLALAGLAARRRRK